MIGLQIAVAAEAFVGTRFRLHGRDPQTGLDCIGLLAATFRSLGRQAAVPNGYHLRTGRWPRLDELADDLGFKTVSGPALAGDVALFRPSASQMHFAIAGVVSGTWVEAHAGLRRVVISTALPPYRELWRAIEIER